MRIIKMIGKTLDGKTERLLIAPDISEDADPLEEIDVFEMKLSFKRVIPDREGEPFESLYRDFQEYHRTMCLRSDERVIIEPKGHIESKPEVSMGYVKMSPRQLTEERLKEMEFEYSKYEFQKVVFSYETDKKLNMPEVSDFLKNWSFAK